MKIIKYQLCTHANHGTEKEPLWEDILSNVTMGWSEANEAIAKEEAYNGEYIIADDGIEETAAPTPLDILEAQVTYTAMMTDTLLEE